MRKVPDTSGIEKYAKRNFKSFRLKKKQVTTLKNTYIKLCKRHKVLGMSLTVTGPIPKREEYACRISILRQGLETINRAKDIPIVRPYENDDTPYRQLEKMQEEGL